MKRVKQSFTLIEILVVIVIIGILSSFIFFTINDSVEKAQIAKSKMFSESIRNNLLLNLVSEWSFDDNTNLGIDSWGSNNAQSIEGSPQFKAINECVSGNCIEFNGSSDYIEYGDVPALRPVATNRTFSFWTYSDLFGNYTVFSTGNGYMTRNGLSLFYINESSVVISYDFSNTSYLTLNCSTQTKKWTFFTLLIETEGTNSDISLYQNGNFKDSDSMPRNLTTGYLGTFKIAGMESGADCDVLYLFNGKIDEFKIYDDIISESQINQKYLAGLNNLYAKGMISTIEYNEKINNLAQK